MARPKHLHLIRALLAADKEKALLAVEIRDQLNAEYPKLEIPIDRVGDCLQRLKSYGEVTNFRRGNITRYMFRAPPTAPRYTVGVDPSDRRKSKAEYYAKVQKPKREEARQRHANLQPLTVVTDKPTHQTTQARAETVEEWMERTGREPVVLDHKLDTRRFG